jgi:hypothetical protein
MNERERDELRRRIDAARREQIKTIECVGCGKPVPRISDRTRFCSRACANRTWHRRMDRKETE